MTDRIRFDANGARVSKPGVDVNTADVDNLTLYPGMSSMSLVAEGTQLISGGSRIAVPINNPTSRMPYVIINDASGTVANRQAFCAETSPPYNSVFIRNDVQSGAPARTITYAILIDNSFV